MVEAAEGGRMVSVRDHQERHISALRCLAEPAGIHEQQRAIPGSHKSERATLASSMVQLAIFKHLSKSHELH